MLRKAPLDAAGKGGDGASNGEGPGGAARQDVEFGVMLEGGSVSGVEIDDSNRGEGVEGGTPTEGAVREGEGTRTGLGDDDDEGIEMMELGGEWRVENGMSAVPWYLFQGTQFREVGTGRHMHSRGRRKSTSKGCLHFKLL